MESLLGWTRSVARVDARLEGQIDVLLVLDAMFDVVTHHSIEGVAKIGSIRLFDHVFKHTQRQETDRFLVRKRMTDAMSAAIKNKDVLMVKYIHLLHPEPLALKSIQLALDVDCFELVQWLMMYRFDGLCLTAPPREYPANERLLDCCLEGEEEDLRVLDKAA